MKLKVGSSVSCRLYNSVEGRFYGQVFHATVKAFTEGENERRVIVNKPDGLSMTLHRKEIIRVLS